MAAKRRARRPRSDGSKEVGRNEGSDDDEESGETAIPAKERSAPLPEDAGVQRSGEVSPPRASKTKRKRPRKRRPADDSGYASLARVPLPDDSADAGHRAAAQKRSPPPLQEEERPEKRAAGPDADTVAASAPRLKKNRRKKKKKKQLRKPTPPPQEDEDHGREMAEHEPSNTSLPEDELGEEQEKKTPEQEHAGGTCNKDMHSAAHGQEPHADGAQPSPRLNLRSDPEPEPMGFWGVEVKPGEPYAHDFSGCVRVTQATLGNLKSVCWTTITCTVGSKMPVSFCALKSESATYRLDLEYGKGQNVVFSVTGDSSVHLAGYYKIPDAADNVQALVTQIQEADDRETTHVHGTAQKHNALDAGVHNDGTNQMVGQAGLNAAVNIQALVTQSQEAADHKTIHAHDIARGRNALETEVHTDCTNQMVGQSGLNILIPDAAAKVQALVTQSQEADDRVTTHVHGIAHEHNTLDTEVQNDGTDQMVGQAGLNAAANIKVLVTQSQEDDDHETTHAHEGRNAPETDVHNGGPNQMVGQSGLNMKISNEASLGSSNRPVDKEDVGGPISDELKIDELKSGDCNAEMASDGKEVEVKYIGMLTDGTVFDSFEGRPAIYTFTLGVDNIIAGWNQGIKGMRVGGKRKLTIPPALGYKDIPQKEPQKEIPGEPQKETIPANSWLVYEIELLKVSEPGEKLKKSRSMKHH